jgi:hypothetical protein
VRTPSVDESEPGSGDDVANRAGYEDLVGIGERADPGTDVDRDARELVADHLDLSRVHTQTNRQPEASGRGDDRVGAPDSAGGPIERRKESVARRVYLTPR